MIRAIGSRKGGGIAPVVLAVLVVGQPACAHPMGNFAICHYTRFQADRNTLRIRYILDIAEIPTVGEKETLDRNHDGTIDATEKAAYLAAKAPELLAGLQLSLNNRPVPLKQTGGTV